MRVISGSLRGLKLKSPEGLDTRPTLDRVKEALFSMLFDRFSDAFVLDLFAGSGALGIEALSRGAAHCTFVDSGREAVDAVKSNIEKARLEDRSKIVFEDSVSFLKKATAPFDIIFLDPPYKAGLYGEVLKTVRENRLLKDGGALVAECESTMKLDTEGYTVLKDKKYGKVRLYVLEVSG